MGYRPQRIIAALVVACAGVLGVTVMVTPRAPDRQAALDTGAAAVSADHVARATTAPAVDVTPR
jgi:hypothetical protein